MAFVKLDCGMLDSTIWIDRDAREVFVTALLMASPVEITEPAAQISVESLEPTGWCVPPGWYGFVAAAGPGIIRRAGVDPIAGIEALKRLGNPEAESRTPDHEGRRMVRVSGGYIILNFIKYREKDATTADRSRRWRERQKMKALQGVTSNVSTVTTRVIRHQAEADAEVPKGTHLPTARTSSLIPKTEAEVIEWGKFDGVPEEQCRRFFNHFESMGWIDRNGNPVAKARNKLAVWAADDRAKQNQGDKGKPAGAISASMQASLDKTELDRIEAEINRTLNAYEAHQSLSPKDREKLAPLRARRSELKTKLGFAV